MKIKLRPITVMLGLLAIASMIFTSPTMLSMTMVYASTSQPDTLRIEEVGNDGNNAEMVKMTVKEGNNPSEREDDFELDPEDNAIFVPKGKNVQVTNDGLRFFRAVATQGDVDKQIPISTQGVINLNSLDQGFYYLDVVIQDGNTKVAYEAILFIGPRNAQNEDTVNKEVNRTDKDVTITKRITNIDKTVICGENQKFNDKTKKCENIPPPPCKPGQTSTKDKPCTPPKPPTKTPTPDPTKDPTKTPGPTPPVGGTGPGGEKPTCLTTGNKPGRISSNAKICTPFDGSAPTPIRGPIDVIVPIPIPCIEGQTPERNNCVATTPPGTQFPQCITPGNPPNCVPGPDTKPGATVGTACMTVDGKPGKVAPNGACTQVPQAGPAGTTPSPTPTPLGAPAGLTPGSTDLIGSPCTLPDGKPGKVAGAVGDMNCEPTGIGGATTAPTGPVGSDCALPGGNTGGKVMNTNNGIACVGTPTPRDALPVEPTPPQTPTDTGEPRPSCTTPDGQPGMMGMREGRLSCTPIEDQRPTISSLTPEPEELPAPTDPTELANFCVDNPQHSACQTPTTPPDQTSQLTPVPEPNVPDAQTETEDPDAQLFGPTEPTEPTQGTTERLPGSTGIEGDPCPEPNEDQVYPNCPEPIPDPTPEPTPIQCEDGSVVTPPQNCPGDEPPTPTPVPQPGSCEENPNQPKCDPPDCENFPDDPRCPRPPVEPVDPLPGQTLAETTPTEVLCPDGITMAATLDDCPPEEELELETEPTTQECSDGSIIPTTEECPTDEELGTLEGETEAGTGTEFEDFASEEQQQTDNTGDQGDPNEGGDSGEAEFESDDSGQQSDEEE